MASRIHFGEILDVVEEENRKRESSKGVPVTLINDSCLAFAVLIHNDGRNGRPNLRLLDLASNCITPIVVMLDAHKHLGADKGVSMSMGTRGALSPLKGAIRVGAAPCKGELVRAIADLSLVGVEGYYAKYHTLVSAVETATRTMEASGMMIIHSNHRIKGSTVLAVEDPSALTSKKLKKKGHSTSPIYCAHPEAPHRCQTGFQLSLTPHCLRQMKDGKSALEIFTDDAVEAHRDALACYPPLAKRFRENSLLAILLCGGDEAIWALDFLRRPGVGREIVSLMLRRIYSAILDSGVVCSKRHPTPLRTVSQHLLLWVLLQGILMLILRKGHSIKRRLRFQ